jgi:uncharacterized repeat protein (TIGR01451 family)
MKAKWIKQIVGLLGFALVSTVAHAEPQPVELHGDVKLEKTVIENGATKQLLVEPAVVVPGDRLLFSTTYRNTGAEPVKNFVVTNPLPAGVALSDLGAEPAQVSVDGGKAWGALAALKVADGKGGQRAAVTGDVTHVRWTLALVQPRAAGALSFQAIVR